MLPSSDVFEASLRKLREDGRYRTFIELERNVGTFPTAIWRHPDGSRRPVTVWCSNDYLGMGLGHSEHRIQPTRVAPWSSPSSTRDVDPGRRPEHYLQGRGSHALTALLRGVLPPGTGPSTKGR